MNVLNRSGVFIVGIVSCVLCYVLLKSILHQFWNDIGNLLGLSWAFLLGMEGRFMQKNDWYLYKFYPIDFFDRNFLVILIYLNLAVFFSDIFLHPVSIIVFVIILILNELRMRKVYEKREIRDNEMKEILGHQGYDGEKIVLKKTSKNFFVRTWFFLLGMIPFSIIIPVSIFDSEVQTVVFKIFIRITLILLFIYELYNMKKIYKEIKEIMGESAIVTDR